MAEPFITIKKADGSTEKVPFSEWKKRQAQKNLPPPAPKPVSLPASPTLSSRAQSRDPLISAKQEISPLAPLGRNDKKVSPVPSVAKTPASPLAIIDRVKELRSKSEPSNDLPVRPHKDDFILEEMLPEKIGEREPTTYQAPPTPALSTPFNSFVTSGVTTPRAEAPKVAPAASTSVPTPIKKTVPTPIHKPMINDIASARPAIMNPLDEITYFNLTDFRRLSSDPTEAAARLKQKFTNLKEESVVLYFEALTAWRNSPLYLDYMKAVAKTLAGKIPLGQLSSTPNDIKIAEINALVAMEKTL